MGLPLVMVLLHGGISESMAVPVTVLVNLLVLGSAIVLVQQGLLKGLSQYFYSGVALLLVLGMMRYVDLVGDYVGGSVLFLLAAGILFLAAHYWRDRQGGAGHE